MARYIDADKIPFYREKEGNTTIEYAYKSDIDKIPAADVRPEIHSKWGVYKNYLICMRCNFSYEINGKVYNFCPDCGAKMDGKDIE